MPSKYWWINKATFKVFNKYFKTIYYDGCGYSLNEWNNALNEIREMKPGDSVFNYYKQRWTTVKSIKYIWEPIQSEFGKRVIGKYICGFEILCEDQYILRNSPSMIKEDYQHTAAYNSLK